MSHQKNTKQIKKSRPLLTIGLIVKNEEKTLGRCLDSLKLLLTQLNAELVITDTGSTDRTVEIARRYTDNVRFFQWCNDFAAARNDGVDCARGEWFLSIDADEWFEDATEIVDFFKSGEYKKYRVASYQVHSYLYMDKSGFTDCAAVRMFQKSGNVRYEGAIHERFLFTQPVKVFSCFVHHTGYAPESKEQAQAKHQRNLIPLLEEIKMYPDNERSFYHLLNEYISTQNWDEVLRYKQCVMQILKNKPNSSFRGGLYKLIICAEVESKHLKDAESTAAEYFASNKQVYMADLDIWFMLTNVYLQMVNTEKAVEAASNYLKLFKQYKKGDLRNVDIFSGVMLSVTSEYYTVVFSSIVAQLLHERAYESILLIFAKVDLEQLGSIRNEEAFWEGLLLAAIESEHIEELHNFLEKIMRLKEPEKCHMAIRAFFTRIAASFDRDFYQEIVCNLLIKSKKFTYVLYEIYSGYTFGSEIKLLNGDFFVLTIFEQLLFGENLEINKKRNIFGIYVEQMWSYVQQVYHPELWKNQHFDLLPGFARFVYIARESEGGLLGKADLGYLREMIKAAELYPVMLPFLKEHLLDIKMNKEGIEQ